MEAARLPQTTEFVRDGEVPVPQAIPPSKYPVIVQPAMVRKLRLPAARNAFAPVVGDCAAAQQGRLALRVHTDAFVAHDCAVRQAWSGAPGAPLTINAHAVTGDPAVPQSHITPHAPQAFFLLGDHTAREGDSSVPEDLYAVVWIRKHGNGNRPAIPGITPAFTQGLYVPTLGTPRRDRLSSYPRRPEKHSQETGGFGDPLAVTYVTEQVNRIRSEMMR